MCHCKIITVLLIVGLSIVSSIDAKSTDSISQLRKSSKNLDDKFQVTRRLIKNKFLSKHGYIGNRNYAVYNQLVRPRLERVKFLCNTAKRKKIVAVIEEVGNNQMVLNPTIEYEIYEVNYNEIPKLDCMNLMTADRLWGTNTTSANEQQNAVRRRYRLYSKSIPEDNNRYYLECVFKNELLSKYRITVNAFKHYNWIDL